MAWLDGTPTEPEMVLNPKDTQNFIALKDAMRSIADGNNPLSELFGGDEGAANVLSQLAKLVRQFQAEKQISETSPIR